MLRIEKLFVQGFKSFCDPTEVVFDAEGITAVVGPNGCGKCVDGSTLVTLADGREVTIRELVETALAKSGCVEQHADGTLTRENPYGIEILSLNPATLRLEPRPVAAFIKRTATPHLLHIRTRSGREVTATPYHPLFTLENGRLRALKAEEVQVGVRLAVPRYLPVAGQTVKLPLWETLQKFATDDRLYVPYSPTLYEWAENVRHEFGAWTAWVRAAALPEQSLKGFLDGQAINTETLIKLAQLTQIPPPLAGCIKTSGTGHLQLPPVFTPELARFLGLLIAEGRNNAGAQIWFVNSDEAVNQEFRRLAQSLFGLAVHQYQYKACATDSLIYSRALGLVLERLFNFPVKSTSAEKAAPPQIFQADPVTQWAFLSGLFEGDAYLCCRQRQDNDKALNYLEYTTASPQLAQQVVSLLLRLGVFALLRKRRKYASNTVEKICRDYYSVLIYGTEQLRFVAQHLSFAGEKRRALAVWRELAPAANPNMDVIPGATALVKEAARAAGVKMKLHRRQHAKLAAYVEQRCEASRTGLREVIGQIERLGSTPEAAHTTLQQLATLAQSDLYWDEIVSVEQVAPQEEWVYDLSIAETHNFVAGNIVVHNSNIADSLSWVIGEQRPKAMRGGKMEDVIFTGSRNRQSAGMAEVMLTLYVTETFEIRGEMTPPATIEPDETAPLQLPPAPETVVAEAAEATPNTAETPASETEDKTKKRRKAAPKTLAKVFQEGERITVGRRLYRTGESEYELNGRSCRLRDIQDLFAGTGLGGAHYAIIEQGRIGQVLSAKPLDRRALLEEAAGISKFKMRQHAAELKLEGARNNLARLADILAEVERQQASLKRQAAKARRYARLRQELRDLLRAVYVVDYRTTQTALGALEEKLHAIAAREAQTLASIAGLEAEQARATQAARAAEETLNDTRERAAQIELESERARQQRNYLTEHLQSLSERAAQFAHDQAVIGERNEVINQETARLRADLQRLDQEINAESKTLAAEEEQQQALLARDAEAEQRLEEARKKVYDATTQLERWRQLQRQFAEAVDRSQTRLQGLAVERERAQTQAQAAEAAYDALTEQLDASADRQQAISEQLATVSAQLTEQRRHREARQTALTATQHELTATEHRLKSLRELDERHAYFSEAVQLLFNRPAHANSFQTFGTLADFVHVAPEHEAMVETGLREELQYVVVPTYNDALKAIEFLKSTGGGRATFLVTGLHAAAPSSVGPSLGHETHTNSHAGTLHSLLNLRPDLADAFQLALPGLAGAQIVEDLAQAIENSNGNGHAAVVLARTGERLSAGRLVTGGSRSETGKGVLALKREIAELTDHLTALTTANEVSAAALGLIKTQVAELDELRARLDSELRLVEKQSAVLREQFQQGERERQRIATLLRVVETETAQVEREHADFTSKLEHAAEQTSAAQTALAEVQEIVAAAQNELAELRRRTDQRAQELSRRRAEFAAKTERRRGLQNDLRRLEHEASDLGNRLARLRMEAVAADEQNTILQTNLADTAQRIEQLAAQQAELAQELAARTAELGAARAQVEALEGQLRALREAATNAREERAQAEIEGARLTSNLEHIAASCYNELNERLTDVLDRLEKVALTSEVEAQPVTALAPLPADDNGEDEESDVVELSFWQVPEDFDLELAKARLDELRARIENLGPVNMMALQELTEVEERQIFLTSQKADIEKAVADTQAAIAEIKRRSRERFQDAFTAINENFKQMFQELFGGGHGEMRLIDESDILESGIEIIAQPPGKRLQNVLLLSGGEKAMAALALVLAIFRYRPSPFCLLDEVDAPLDEMNIGRFAEKVIEMSRNTQFLIITHSKRTMEIAQTLYGVTMEDPGVSKLISVRLS